MNLTTPTDAFLAGLLRLAQSAGPNLGLTVEDLRRLPPEELDAIVYDASRTILAEVAPEVAERHRRRFHSRKAA